MLEYADFQQDFCSGKTDMKLFYNCPYQISGCAVFLALEGEAIISIGIQEFVFKKDCEMVVLPTSTLTLFHSTENFMCSVFIFSKELYDELSIKLNIDFSSYLLTTPFYAHNVGSIKLKYFLGLMNFAQIIYNQRNVYFWEELYHGFVQTYLIYLYNAIREYLAETNKNSIRKNKLYQQFISLVNEYWKEHRDVEFYADKMNITVRYLWIISDYASESKSPKNIIDKRLILEIKLLLRSTDLSIKEIADELNFANQSYLGKYFKYHTGISPSEYRKAELSKSNF